MLFRTYEQLIVEASLDVAFARHLLADPRRAAMDAGYDTLVAESLVGLGGETLEQFAMALYARVYGRRAPQRHGKRAVATGGYHPGVSDGSLGQSQAR